MGLDTTHDCWHGGYGSFRIWRECVARAAGVPLNLMDGFYRQFTTDDTNPSYAWASPRLPDGPTCGSYHGPALTDFIDSVAAWLPLSWEDLKPDPVHILLNHSDCDGEIAVEDCAPLADRLEELLPQLHGLNEHWTDDWARGKAQQFIDGLRAAAKAGEVVEFG